MQSNQTRQYYIEMVKAYNYPNALKCINLKFRFNHYGKRGSRTLGSLATTSVFKTDALNHSATFPFPIMP